MARVNRNHLAARINPVLIRVDWLIQSLAGQILSRHVLSRHAWLKTSGQPSIGRLTLELLARGLLRNDTAWKWQLAYAWLEAGLDNSGLSESRWNESGLGDSRRNSRLRDTR